MENNMGFPFAKTWGTFFNFRKNKALQKVLFAQGFIF